MADWATFAGVGGVVTLLVLLLAHASQSLVSGGTATADATLPRDAGGEPRRESVSHDPAHLEVVDDAGWQAPGPATPSVDDLSSLSLLVNVVATQAFFGAFLLGGVWYARVPLSALGVAVPSAGDVAVGGALGAALFGANQVAASAGRRFGLGGGDRLRTALAPDSRAGWAFLLLVALPVVAAFEELLFRGALVGGLAAGFAVSPWPLAVLASVAFAFGHGAQGRVGVVVTGVLGFVFAAAFVLTGSLFVVVLAHYLVNALEFVVHEALG